MKKLFFTLLFSPFFFLANAQSDPTLGEDTPSVNDGFLRVGRMYAGGTIAYTGTGQKHEETGSTTNGPKQSNLTILPEVGYVFSDKFAGDLALGYASSKSVRYETNSGGGDDWELTNSMGMFLINPMLKAYKKLSNRLYCMPSLGFSLGFGSGTNQNLGLNNDTFEPEVISEEYKETSFGVDLRTSLKYFPSENWALSFSYGAIYYDSSTSTSKEDSSVKWKNSSYGLDLDLSSIRVGAYYFFR